MKPVPKGSRTRHRDDLPIVLEYKSDSFSEGSEESEGSVESDSDRTDDSGDKIPKPDGEAGRPGRGGYNLEVALGWSPKLYKKLKVCHYLFLIVRHIGDLK
jgi:hypothetical protein